MIIKYNTKELIPLNNFTNINILFFQHLQIKFFCLKYKLLTSSSMAPSLSAAIGKVK